MKHRIRKKEGRMVGKEEKRDGKKERWKEGKKKSLICWSQLPGMVQADQEL